MMKVWNDSKSQIPDNLRKIVKIKTLTLIIVVLITFKVSLLGILNKTIE